MTWSGRDLERATEAARALLEELGLEAYLFAIEPREGDWELKLECALKEGWQTIALPVELDLLLASRTESGARARLLQSWRDRMAACLKSADRISDAERVQGVRVPEQPSTQRGG